MPKRPKIKHPLCPCCKKAVYLSDMRATLKACNTHWAQSKNGNAASFKAEEMDWAHYVGWACDDCVHSRKAIAANPRKVFNSGMEHFFYCDIPGTCQTCSAPFVFSKEKQRKWYEGYGFHIDSKEVLCQSCRNAESTKRKDNLIIAELLKKETLSEEECNTLTTIYIRLGNSEKANMYKNLALKAARRKH